MLTNIRQYAFSEWLLNTVEHPTSDHPKSQAHVIAQGPFTLVIFVVQLNAIL